MQKAELLLRSKAIFTGMSEKTEAGFIAISDGRITAVGTSDGRDYCGSKTIVYDLGERFICPGFVDVHCFFTGHLLTLAGEDLGQCTSYDDVLSAIKNSVNTKPTQSVILGRNLKPDIAGLTQKKLDMDFGILSVILFKEGGESCYMNSSAINTFKFTPETCYSESYWRLLRYILNDRGFSVPEFRRYLHMMNSRGITSIKEMGFDDFYGFTDVLKNLEDEESLTARVHFMSQPTGSSMDLDYANKMKSHFSGNFVHFSGFNQMTDGSISQIEAEMKTPYACSDTCCSKSIDWERLKIDTLKADSAGFRYSLHAQGDSAIAKTVDIFAQCQRDLDGKVINRHAITDLECSDPADIERMGNLGIIAEIYPQIMSLADRQSKLAMIGDKIGMERGKNYWNRRKMADSGVVISCGTDLPLLYDDIPESIYHSVGARFPEGGAPFNQQNTLTIFELLRAWTLGGQYNLGCEKELGTLQIGKLADITVLDANVLNGDMDSVRNVSVYMTIVNGKVVYKKAYFMGIDTGTNSSKGVLIDENCNIIASHSTEHEMTNPKPGHYEHDAEKDWWGDFCVISRSLIEKSGVDPADILAVGPSALGADCLPVDENCRPLRKAILYGIDSRAVKEMESLTELYGEKQIKKWYGRPLCSSDVMPKILWIKNNEPEIYEKTHKFITASTFLTARLTGNYVVDRFLGLASFNPLYHHDGTPNSELCLPICRPDQLAAIKEANDLAGAVTAKAAGETGLKEGTPVITGTDDSGAEAISIGVVAPGKMMLQFGSSIYMILGTKELVDDDRLWREEFIVPGLCDISAGTNAAGSLTKWFKDTIFSDAAALEKTGGPDAYQTMLEGVELLPPGSGGLITLPYFAGERTPINDPMASGCILGLNLSHTRTHLYRSALESVAYSVNQQLQIMEAHKDVAIEQIFAVGGGVQNQLWMQIVADVTGKEINTPLVTIGASFGDAMMAATAVKYPGFEDFSALTKFIKPGKTYCPDPEKHVVYQTYQDIYDRLYPATAELMHCLAGA